MGGIGLVSPGVKVREVDLTVGRIDSISDQTGAIVGLLKEPCTRTFAY